MTLREFKNKLALEIPQEELDILDIGSSHSYECRCDTCFKWWVLCYSPGEDTGPFTEEELRKEAVKKQKSKK